MYGCISTAQFSILINGSLNAFFGSSCNLRQGDLLLPFFFVIVMEALRRLLFRATIRGYLLGFWVDIQNAALLEISNLLFADITLIMCDANGDQATIWVTFSFGLKPF
jgi:hypothetical protein